MKTTVNFNDFCDAFKEYARGEQFTYAALREIFDYLTEWEEGSGQELELDVIAVCCDFAEATLQEFAEQYDILAENDSTNDDETPEQLVQRYIEERGGWYAFAGRGVVYAQF